VSSKRTVLIDCDPPVYRAGFAAQSKVYDLYDGSGNCFAEGVSKEEKDRVLEMWKGLPPSRIESRVVAEPVENALANFRNIMMRIGEATGCTLYRGYLTGSGNFRDTVATIQPYKGNRDKDHKPVHYEAIREYAVHKWGAKVVDGIEADDAISIEHTRRSESTIIASVDKDFDQLSGWHYNPTKDVGYFVTPEQATYNFYKQCLTGDTADNILGIPGIGPRTAERILENITSPKALYWRVLLEYQRVAARSSVGDAFGGLSAEAALHETATLLWLLREPNKMWEPPV
jgi:hypothetical protein